MTEKPLKDWTDDELKKEAKAMNHLIYVAECYGSSDMVWLFSLQKELKRRGIEPVQTIEFT